MLAAATGGVFAYRALFVTPRARVIVIETGKRELPYTLSIKGSVILLIGAAALAFLAARRGRT